MHLLFHIFGYFTSLCICIFISTKILSPNKICIEERQSSHSFVSRKIIVDKILRKKRKKRRKRTIKSLSRNKASRSRRSIYQIGEWNEGTKETCRQKKKKVSSTTLSRFFIHPSKRSLFDDTIYYSHPIFSSPSCSQIRRKFVATTGFIAFHARFWSICSTFRIVSRILLRCVNYRDNWSGGW